MCADAVCVCVCLVFVLCRVRVNIAVLFASFSCDRHYDLLNKVRYMYIFFLRVLFRL